VVVDGDLDFESVVKMSDGLNGADLRNVVTEALVVTLGGLAWNLFTDLWRNTSGLFAIKDYRDSINQDDFNKAVRKVAEAKKLEASSPLPLPGAPYHEMSVGTDYEKQGKLEYTKL
jgi:26S proteasome regulatory subunit T4